MGETARGRLSILDRIYGWLLNDHFIMTVIIINAVIIFVQESTGATPILDVLDAGCTLIFLCEMIAKQRKLGIRGYWKSGMNLFDGLIVLLSVPSMVALFLPESVPNLSFLLALRMFRIFRFFRLVRFFPGIDVIFSNFRLALRQSYGIMLSFVVLIITFALISCCLFSRAAPEFFATPLDSFYSIFRLFTIEGWYEIPDAVAQGLHSPVMLHVVRIYFCALLIAGGIIGMSLINSIFVDAMVSDNNDDVKAQLDKLEAKVDELTRLLQERRGND